VIGSGWRSAPRWLALVAAAALIPVLAGCEAGNNAPTLDFHYPTDAAGITVGDLAIQNVFVLGAPLGRNLAAGRSASVFLALVNTNGTPDRLLSITAPGTAASVTIPGSISVANGHPVLLTGPRPQVVLTDLTRTLTSGSNVRLIFTFQQAGPVQLVVPVFSRAAHFVTYAPPQPAPAPTVRAIRHRGSSATPSPSPSGSVTLTATPSPSTTP
jgi:copper(I)-binding protein